MIISASRRTDIPAFYGDWFYNRLLAKEVIVRNPLNRKILTRIPLDPKYIECIVFWTKNPQNFLKFLEPISSLGYHYYFQFTLTTYDHDFEIDVEKKNIIINTFKELSNQIGSDKVIWRYDPIIINEKFTFDYHLKWFDYLCKNIAPYTNKCVFSFVDQYNFLKKDFQKFNITESTSDQMIQLSKNLSNIARKNNIVLSTCSEKIDLSIYGIEHNKCIDDILINKINHTSNIYRKDTSQREECGCIVSRDIGTYNSCKHNCIYCYAKKGQKTDQFYDPLSPILCDKIQGDEKITTLKISNKKNNNLELF